MLYQKSQVSLNRHLQLVVLDWRGILNNAERVFGARHSQQTKTENSTHV
jgi:hypothetical protein